MIPVDVTEVLVDGLKAGNRQPDGKLHPSTHLASPLRHAMLDAAGAPKHDLPIVNQIRLQTGTFWHEWLHDRFRALGLPVMCEVKLDPWLPEGWAGTADWLFWHPEFKAFVLSDCKTQKGEGMPFVHEKAKDDHLWQASSYWHALHDMGLPLVRGFGIYYMPINVPGKEKKVAPEHLLPVMQPCRPYPRDVVHGRMLERKEAVDAYLATFPREFSGPYPDVYKHYVNDLLAPPREREQRVFWDGKKEQFDLKLVPHWSTGFCDYPNELCDCSTQGTTKIGQYALDGTYTPRKGYEDVAPLAEPTEAQFRKHRSSQQV